MHRFFSDLKKAREAQKITLDQISAKTRIDVKFLKAIEDGNVRILPEAYIKAFLREYALAAGLDQESVMKEFAEAIGTPVQTPPPAPAPTFDDTTQPKPTAEKPDEKTSLPMRPWTKLGFTAVVFVGLLLAIWMLIPHNEPLPVEETPFDKVIQENEKRALPAPPDSTPPPQSVLQATDDSLSLHATTFDSVWLRVIADSRPPQEYLFKANTSVTWRARERFTLFLGNGGGVRFTLGKKDLGFLGKPGSVLRNVQITRAGATLDTTTTR